MFGTSGIRGPVGETVTGQLALDLGRALGSMADRIVVGRDARTSGSALEWAAIAGAQEAGSEVVSLGIESTPTVARAVDWYDSSAGLVVTASHNPPEDNGFKFWTRSGQAFGPDLTATLSRRIEDTAALTVPPAQMGSVRRVRDASRRHLEALPKGDCGSLSVVVDLGNGTGQLTVEALLARGCDVTAINAQRDGSFPGRPSEPTAANCTELSTIVRDGDADLGIAHDGDADRLMAVDETGRFVSGDELLTLFAIDALSTDGVVAAPVNASALLDTVVGELGGSVVRTAVGDGNVAAACAEPGVVFGGEPSGAWIWPTETLAPDAHYAACRLVDILGRGGTLSDRTDSFPRFVTKRESVRSADGSAIVAAITDRVRERYDDVTELDGVRVDTADGWFLVRASGTEPLVRLTAEARTERRATELLEESRGLLDGVRSTQPKSNESFST
ncbi:phosphopentomutase/phosphoglucosamine mutase [Halodesulfurarchaeum formicicum]|uniref:Phosphoglucosamine mutase n=1 Tax=Halodesulfurarchaeum formicicum TaxID=1873524 RepID=A0A1J1AAB8_9EURY|nr:phosphopentomutase/phosphoglucosamine mutase [Halodesulfurarchaeum formicicum]APE95084.1 phosphoglucosamine mutase [Halodesulfurarchaeum formicicum]